MMLLRAHLFRSSLFLVTHKSSRKMGSFSAKDMSLRSNWRWLSAGGKLSCEVFPKGILSVQLVLENVGNLLNCFPSRRIQSWGRGHHITVSCQLGSKVCCTQYIAARLLSSGASCRLYKVIDRESSVLQCWICCTCDQYSPDSGPVQKHIHIKNYAEMCRINTPSMCYLDVKLLGGENESICASWASSHAWRHNDGHFRSLKIDG